MLELRIINSEGKLSPTANEKLIPPVKNKPKLVPNQIILADFCFNENETFLKWKQNVKTQELGIVIYNKKGRIEMLSARGKKIGDEEKIFKLVRNFAQLNMTCYELPNGKTAMLFFIPSYHNLEKLIK